MSPATAPLITPSAPRLPVRAHNRNEAFINVMQLRSAVSRFKKYGGVVVGSVLQRRRLAMAMAVGVLILLPLLSGDPEVFVLNAIVIGLAALVIRKLVLASRRKQRRPGR